MLMLSFIFLQKLQHGWKYFVVNVQIAETGIDNYIMKQVFFCVGRCGGKECLCFKNMLVFVFLHNIKSKWYKRILLFVLINAVY
jgi:hypothetical protein